VNCMRSVSFVFNWVVVLFGMAAIEISARAQESFFYRVQTTQGVTTFFDTRLDGVIQWSNSVPSGTYVIERSSSLGTNWVPYVRATNTAITMSHKVWDYDVPTNFVFIPAGFYRRGDHYGDLTVARPVQTVYISPFYIDKFETSNDQMREVLQWAYDNNRVQIVTNSIQNVTGTIQPLFFLNKFNSLISLNNGVFQVKPGRGNHPAVYVTWYGAAAYCNWLSEMHGKTPCFEFQNWTCNFSANGYRLPTEAQWEKAARGGPEGYRFPWTHSLNISFNEANYRSSTNHSYNLSAPGYHPIWGAAGPAGLPYTCPVNEFAPNGFGLHNVAGNAWEWCSDWAVGRYFGDNLVDPMGPATGTYKIFRGGSYFTTEERLVCASRYVSFLPERAFDDIGFRVTLPYQGP
jgi:formylglycine-generating enzyme required for sulfatase activity